MLGLEKLEIAKVFLEKELGSLVKDLFFNDMLVRIRVVLQNGNIFIVYYNDHDQYSYSLIFSSKELDRCRFDNFDKEWDVNTAPHHFHPRLVIEGFDSPMIDAPDADIPNICDLIKKDILLDSNHRFQQTN